MRLPETEYFKILYGCRTSKFTDIEPCPGARFSKILQKLFGIHKIGQLEWYFGLTWEYPATPKVILKRVATWLRSYVATRLGSALYDYASFFV